jgi:MYXO-CTERM domain-containing protein
MATDPDCPSGNDCDDANANVYPGAHEYCNQVDDNCDGQTDEDDACVTDCQDTDGDGHDAIDADCPDGDDCDDTDDSIHPGAEEICDDEVDQDCNGQDLQCACGDADLDGYSDAACGGLDCNDSSAEVHPGASEACNLVDDDCDADTDEELGEISCGIGACFTSISACILGQEPTCEPLDPPEAAEASCEDEVDNDCDGYFDAEDDDCIESSDGCGCSTDEPPAASAVLLLFLWVLALRGFSRMR